MAIGVVVWDLSLMGFAAFKKWKHPNANIIFDGVPLYDLNTKFVDLTDPIIRQHKLESVADMQAPYRWFQFSGVRRKLFKALRERDGGHQE